MLSSFMHSNMQVLIWRCPSCTRQAKNITMNLEFVRYYAVPSYSPTYILRAAARKIPIENSQQLSTFNRSFSSNPRVHQVRRRPPPEAPGYVDIPQPKQPTRVEIQKPKGFLPIPRDVFNRRRGGYHRFRHKELRGPYSSAPGTLGYYINKTAPAPKRRYIGPLVDKNLPSKRSHAFGILPRHRNVRQRIGAVSEGPQYRAWRERQAESRRRNLQEGLAHMARRRARFRTRRSTKLTRLKLDRLRRLQAPRREDERLTAPTVPLVLQPLKRGPLPDPDGPARQARKLRNVAAQKARKEEEISSALHMLYMQARNFIVTDEQLDLAVENAFGTEEKPRMWRDGPSFWHDETMWPPTIQGMLDQEAGLGRGAPIPPERLEGNSGDDLDAARRRVMKERLKKIAEELTGGKM